MIYVSYTIVKAGCAEDRRAEGSLHGSSRRSTKGAPHFNHFGENAS